MKNLEGIKVNECGHERAAKGMSGISDGISVNGVFIRLLKGKTFIKTHIGQVSGTRSGEECRLLVFYRMLFAVRRGVPLCIDDTT